MINAPDLSNFAYEPDRFTQAINPVIKYIGDNSTLIFVAIVAGFVFLWWINRRLRGKDKY